MTAWEPFVQLGAAGLLLLVLWLVTVQGALRTKFEMDVREERTKRAEDQVDKLVPTVELLADQVRDLAAVVRDQTALIRQAMEAWDRERGYSRQAEEREQRR